MRRWWDFSNPRSRVSFHMIIRPAKIDETGSLSRLAWEAKQHWGYSLQTMESWRDELTIDARRFAESPPMVAELDGEIAATYRLVEDGDDVELDFLWVHPKFMRRGIGGKLIAHAVAEARSRGAKKLNIDADPNAVDFYVRCGAYRLSKVSAPIDEQPNRVRHLLEIDLRS